MSTTESLAEWGVWEFGPQRDPNRPYTDGREEFFALNKLKTEVSALDARVMTKLKQQPAFTEIAPDDFFEPPLTSDLAVEVVDVSYDGSVFRITREKFLADGKTEIRTVFEVFNLPDDGKVVSEAESPKESGTYFISESGSNMEFVNEDGENFSNSKHARNGIRNILKRLEYKRPVELKLVGERTDASIEHALRTIPSSIKSTADRIRAEFKEVVDDMISEGTFPYNIVVIEGRPTRFFVSSDTPSVGLTETGEVFVFHIDPNNPDNITIEPRAGNQATLNYSESLIIALAKHREKTKEEPDNHPGVRELFSLTGEIVHISSRNLRRGV